MAFLETLADNSITSVITARLMSYCYRIRAQTGLFAQHLRETERYFLFFYRLGER